MLALVLDIFAQKNVLQEEACIILEDTKRQQLQTDHGGSFNPGRKKGFRASVCRKQEIKGAILYCPCYIPPEECGFRDLVA